MSVHMHLLCRHRLIAMGWGVPFVKIVLKKAYCTVTRSFLWIYLAPARQFSSGSNDVLAEGKISDNKLHELEKNPSCDVLLEESTYHTTTLYKLLYGYGCIPEGWEDFFRRHKEMIKGISDQLDEDKDVNKYGLNPKIGWVFRAFYMVPPNKIKVIVLGQDPAPQPGLATGLSFSLDPSVPSYKVPSVQRVILEAMNEGFCINITKGVLIPWAKQGVLLLNTALTLIPGEIGSHIKLWRYFSREMLKHINQVAQPSVWILWGSKAKYFRKYVNESKHYVIAGGHPPLGQTQESSFA